jgi:undecaprenyl diphosphate synthase
MQDHTIPSGLHVAMILDGNGRWAQSQGQRRLYGHHKGAKALKNVVLACPDLGVRYLTVYAFSSENWKRPKEEVSGLMSLMEQYLEEEIQALADQGVCLKVIGNRQRLAPSLQKLILKAEALTEGNGRLGLQVALSYGGREDIVKATQKLAMCVQNQTMRPEDITETHITQVLWTYPWPDPDLLIRLGGEQRLSNFLLWQLSYSEFVFLPRYFPDFTVQDFREALMAYSQRQRKFGALPSDTSESASMASA